MVSILNLLVPLLGSYGTLYIENQGDEYAKTGIELLNSEVLDKGFKILDDMEKELLEYYDKYVVDD